MEELNDREVRGQHTNNGSEGEQAEKGRELGEGINGSKKTFILAFTCICYM